VLRDSVMPSAVVSLPFHPLADIFLLIEGEEFELFVESILDVVARAMRKRRVI
jgi:hypothetical protein